MNVFSCLVRIVVEWWIVFLGFKVLFVFMLMINLLRFVCCLIWVDLILYVICLIGLYEVFINKWLIGWLFFLEEWWVEVGI